MQTFAEGVVPSLLFCNTVVIRFGELFDEVTSPCAGAGGVAVLAATPPKAPREMPFPKLRRDKSFIGPPFKAQSFDAARVVPLEANRLPNAVQWKLDLARSIDF